MVSEMCSCLQRMEKAGILFDIATYDILIELYKKQNDAAEAVRLLHELRGKGIKPSFHIYRNIIEVKLSSEDMDGAQQVDKNIN